MINYKWDVYQFVSGFELRSLFFILHSSNFSFHFFFLPTFTFGFVFFFSVCWESKSFQFETIACVCVSFTITVIYMSHCRSTKVSHTKQITRNYCTTNRVSSSSLVIYLIVHFHITMMSQKITREDSNSCNKNSNSNSRFAYHL